MKGEGERENEEEREEGQVISFLRKVSEGRRRKWEKEGRKDKESLP